VDEMEIIEGFRLQSLLMSRLVEARVEVGPKLRAVDCFELGVDGSFVIGNGMAGDSLLE
jgi:hypothetical protein